MGKLLTPQQKEQKRRAEAMLEAMKQQGLVIPNKENIEGEKPKKVVYGKKKKPQQKQQQQQQQQPEPEVVEAPVEKSNGVIAEEPKVEETAEEVKPTVEEDIADDWDAEPAEDIADSWDVSDDEGKKQETAESKEATPVPTPEVDENKQRPKSASTEEDEEEE